MPTWLLLQVSVQKREDPLVHLLARVLVVRPVALASECHPLVRLLVLLERLTHAFRLLVVGAPVFLAMYQKDWYFDLVRVVDRRARPQVCDVAAEHVGEERAPALRLRNVC